jgi:bisanhydrobacterioruberin hydratase
MEGQRRIKDRVVIIGIMLFHAVGLAGFLTPKFHDLFIYLVPYHLLLMLLALFYAYGRASLRLLGFFFLTYILGYSAEWIGVHKHWLFGNYEYGPVLGFKISQIPLLIGVNWFLLTFSAGALIQKLGWRGKALRIVAGATLLTLLDVIIEPVAMRFDYWNWVNDAVPFKNYVCWFLLATLMLWLFEIFRFKRLDYAGPVLLVSQFVFFGVLNLA